MDLMDGVDVSRGGDMEFVRGSIVSYPVICTPSHSFASVSLIVNISISFSRTCCLFDS